MIVQFCAAAAFALLSSGVVQTSAENLPRHSAAARLQPTTFTCPEDQHAWSRVCVFRDLAIINNDLIYLYEGSCQIELQHWGFTNTPSKQLLTSGATLQEQSQNCLKLWSKCYPIATMVCQLS